MYHNESQANTHGFIGVRMHPLRKARHAPTMRNSTIGIIVAVCMVSFGAVLLLSVLLKG